MKKKPFSFKVYKGILSLSVDNFEENKCVYYEKNFDNRDFQTEVKLHTSKSYNIKTNCEIFIS